MQERKRQRLEKYDYTKPSAYFVTICAQNTGCRLSDVANGEIVLNEAGMMVQKCWMDLTNHYLNCNLDQFVIMPNHLHGIIHIVRNGLKPFPADYSLSEIIRGFKTFSSRRINELMKPKTFHWQKSFYDRVIRDERELQLVRAYIDNNPLSWELDGKQTNINGNELFVQ